MPATTIKKGSAKFYDRDTDTVILIPGLSDNDIAKLNKHTTDIAQLFKLVNAANSGQRELAYSDLTQPDAPTEGLVSGTYYLVPFNAQNQFLEFDQATGKPKNPQTVVATTDLIVKYFTIMYFNGTALSNVGRQDVQSNIEHVLYDNTNETITADYTFEKDITVNATQEQGLADTKLTTAKFVREHVSAQIAAAGHIVGKYSATTPEDGTLVPDEMVFFPATDALS